MKRIIAIAVAIAFLSAVIVPQKAEAGVLEGALIGALIGGLVGIIIEVSKPKKVSDEQPVEKKAAPEKGQNPADSLATTNAMTDTTGTSRQP